MIDHQQPVEPFQLWLKDRCVWAEVHQRTLFLALLLLAFVIEILIGAASGFNRRVGFGLYYLTMAAIAGAVAANRNRHLWAWGLVAGLFPGVLLGLTYAVVTSGKGAASQPSHLETWEWAGIVLPIASLGILLLLGPSLREPDEKR